MKPLSKGVHFSAPFANNNGMCYYTPETDDLESLGGKRAGQWSVRINGQYRVCFEYADGKAYNVEIVDYH